ncbi:DUF397 domain-containing protein [Streptomyces sp. NPDC052236]|uniref:DUF397 domain-containing protein n=1 Tax=Streptomyces sp. NPDC052236 TaxID=3365686 RepID=UPI0037D434F4
MSTTPPRQWFKSSYSSPEGGNCLEWAPAIAAASGRVPVRDSKNPTGPMLMLAPHAWAELLDFARNSDVQP